MARTLVGAINATQENVTLSAGLTASPGDLFKIDNEVVQFGGYGSIGRNKDFTHKRVIFHRGVGETTAASHSNGAAVVGVADSLVAGSSEAQPSPFASAGQAANANLTAFSGLSLVADRVPYANGTGTLALATFTAAGRALVDDADAAAQRTTLGAAPAQEATTVFLTADRAIAGDSAYHDITDLTGIALAAGTWEGHIDVGVTSAAACAFVIRVVDGAGNVYAEPQLYQVAENSTIVRAHTSYVRPFVLASPATLKCQGYAGAAFTLKRFGDYGTDQVQTHVTFKRVA